MPETQARVTECLARMRAGDDRAGEQLFELVYVELRRRAHGIMRKERGDHTLQTTALVNEAYIRLVSGEALRNLKNRAHFFNTAVQAMHRVLVDQARRRKAAIRGGGVVPIPLHDVAELPAETSGDDLQAEQFQALDAALEELERLNPRHRQVFMLSYYGGLPAGQIAEIIGRSPKTAMSDLRMAKAWIRNRLSRG